MKHLIIGTAGHIDHGKTSLIKALTGRMTDRLKEEQKRGISIELGFTYFDLDDETRVGIVDVPGHEKFIKNMLAGVQGMDAVMLVIAADEGIMPQTEEHLNILNILGVKNGFIVLTKIDMVDRAWIELVKEDIRQKIKGSFLENSEIVEFSSKTLEGIEGVKTVLSKHARQMQERKEKDVPRLPVDRVFVISGHGTIVTGSLIDGNLKVKDEIEVYPQKIRAKIRSIEVHDEAKDIAYHGQRCAINIPGVKKDDISRGSVISYPDSLKNTNLIDCKIRLIEDQERSIKNGQRVFLYIGTQEVIAKVILLDKEVVEPGENAYCQLLLEKEIVCKREDRFIIRFYSPLSTIGGGEVLDSNPQKKKRFNKDMINELKIKEEGNDEYILADLIYRQSKKFSDIKETAVLLSTSYEKVLELLKGLEKEKEIFLIEAQNTIYPISERYLREEEEKIIGEINKYFKKYPLRRGMSKEEFKSKFFPQLKNKDKLFEGILTKLYEGKSIILFNDQVGLSGYVPELDEKTDVLMKNIYKKIADAEFEGIKKEDLLKDFTADEKVLNEIINDLIFRKEIFKIEQGQFITYKNFLKSKSDLINYIKENGSITLAEFRDLINSNRKVSLAILDEFDKQKLTKRVDDKRILQK